jgi:hypothetical protein
MFNVVFTLQAIPEGVWLGVIEGVGDKPGVGVGVLVGVGDKPGVLVGVGVGRGVQLEQGLYDDKQYVNPVSWNELYNPHNVIALDGSSVHVPSTPSQYLNENVFVLSPVFVIVIDTQLPVNGNIVSSLNGSNKKVGVVAEQELYTA